MLHRPGLAVLFLRPLFVAALLRTAWLCDDAFISYRTSDNIINGFGAVWNTAERVQAYTHPLWMWLCTLAFAITGETFLTAIGLSLTVTGLAVTLLITRAAVTPGGVVLIFAALVSSKAFLDYSTSGLENPLSHLLIVLLIWLWWDAPATTRTLRRLTLIASLAMLTRTDLALIVWFPVGHLAWRLGFRAAMTPLVIGLMPLLAWEAFSLFYYGALVPNTAYAKLGSPAVDWSERIARGFAYVKRTAVFDPVTMPIIAAAVIVVIRERPRDLVLVAGAGAYLAYVVNIGGDFMMGRFLTVPFVIGVAVLSRSRWLEQHWRPAAAAIVLVGLLAPSEPAVLSGYGYDSVRERWFQTGSDDAAQGDAYLQVDHITDERRWYYDDLGLFPVMVRGEISHPWRLDGLQLRTAGPKVVTRVNIGLTGFYAGPHVHIVDPLGLADPLLARLPTSAAPATMMAGHYRRDVPAGYLETIASGDNQIADASLAAYYHRIHLVVAGPLWSAERLRTIVGMHLGRYDHHRDAYVAAKRGLEVD